MVKICTSWTSHTGISDRIVEEALILYWCEHVGEQDRRFQTSDLGTA